MHAFVVVHLEDLLYVTDIEEGTGGYVAGGRDGGEPFGGFYQRQGIQRSKGGVGSNRSIRSNQSIRSNRRNRNTLIF